MFTSYQSVKAYLGGKTDRPLPKGSPRASRMINRGAYIAIRYHTTDIVRYYPDHVTIYTNGWRTTTTKRRINDYAPIKVWQEKFEWFVHYRGGTMPYCDGLRFTYEGYLDYTVR